MVLLLRHLSPSHIKYRTLINAVKSHLNSSVQKLSTSASRQDATKNYEGDGKTTISVLNKELKHIILVDTFSTQGFRLNNGIFVVGPMAVFPRTVLQWNVASYDEISIESLSLFCLLEPRIDLLLIGTGEFRKLPKKEVLEFIKQNKMSIEILPTDQACSTFNFLNAEGRCVAGAFIPPESVKLFDQDMKMETNVESMHIIT